MKKFIVNFDESKENDTVVLDGSAAEVNGKRYQYDFKFINDNVLVLRIYNENFFIEVSDNGDEDLELRIKDELIKLRCRSELDVLLESMTNGDAGKRIKKEIHSPMPGIIKKLNVSEGQSVMKGDVLLVLEAMKMENEIRAASDGVIKKIKVSQMNTVEKNELLLEFE